MVNTPNPVPMWKDQRAIRAVGDAWGPPSLDETEKKHPILLNRIRKFAGERNGEIG
jgi:hypothetical protein